MKAHSVSIQTHLLIDKQTTILIQVFSFHHNYNELNECCQFL